MENLEPHEIATIIGSIEFVVIFLSLLADNDWSIKELWAKL